ncbi:MAG: hypothetical protein K2K91_01560 [Ruminococcus sp.]|nr:hypothetical protein [Ruminococcus sp.]
MKKKIPKIILILSFIPYAFVLLYGVYSAFFGFEFFATSYGFQGFSDSIIIMTILLCYFPVIPICLIYQLVYLTVLIIKNRHNVPKKTVLWISSVIALILIIIAVSFIHF